MLSEQATQLVEEYQPEEFSYDRAVEVVFGETRASGEMQAFIQMLTAPPSPPSGVVTAFGHGGKADLDDRIEPAPPSGVDTAAAYKESLRSELDAKIKEEDALLRKVLTGSASRSERRRLEYLKWYTSRIVRMLHPVDLSPLEKVVELQREFRRELESFQRVFGK